MGKLLMFPGGEQNGPQGLIDRYTERDYPRLAAAWTAMQSQLVHLSTPRLDGTGYVWAEQMMLATQPDGEEELSMVTVRGVLAAEGRESAVEALGHLMQAGMGREQPVQLPTAQGDLLQRVHDGTAGYWFEINSLDSEATRDVKARRPESSLSLTAVEKQVSVTGLAAATEYFHTVVEGNLLELENLEAMLATVPMLQD